MTRIDRTFRALKKEGRSALIPFLMAGDPNPALSLDIAREVVRAGASILELGIPFSDPVADGPVIQRAGQRALASGTGIPAVLDIVRGLRAESAVPLVLMTYYNPVFRYGEERFIEDAARAGADGLIIVDLPPEEGRSFFRRARGAGLNAILMVAPTTAPERMPFILKRASGFVYCVARRGTTGARGDLPEGLKAMVAGIRAATGLPVAVGFGLSDARQVAEVLSYADGAVVGSALVEAVEKGESAGGFIRGLRDLATAPRP